PIDTPRRCRRPEAVEVDHATGYTPRRATRLRAGTRPQSIWTAFGDVHSRPTPLVGVAVAEFALLVAHVWSAIDDAGAIDRTLPLSTMFAQTYGGGQFCWGGTQGIVLTHALRVHGSPSPSAGQQLSSGTLMH